MNHYWSSVRSWLQALCRFKIIIIFLEFHNMSFFCQINYIYLFLKFHVIMSFMCSHLKTYGYSNYCVSHLPIWNCHQSRLLSGNFLHFQKVSLEIYEGFQHLNFWLILIESDHMVEYRSLQVFLDLMSLLQLWYLNPITSM